MPILAKVEDVREETPSIKTLALRPEQDIPFKAGQYVELTVPGVGEAPFTPSSSPRITDRMEITIMRVGRVTEKLHQLTPGAEVGIRGPLGRAYPIEEFNDREILIAGRIIRQLFNFLTGLMAESPNSPLPRIRRIKTVSAWSSWLWATAIFLAPIFFAVFKKKR